MDRPRILQTSGRPFYVDALGVTHFGSDGDWFCISRQGVWLDWCRDRPEDYGVRLKSMMVSRATKARIESDKIVLFDEAHVWGSIFYIGPAHARAKAHDAFVKMFNARFMSLMRERLEAVLADRRWRRFFRDADGDHALAGIIAGLFHT